MLPVTFVLLLPFQGPLPALPPAPQKLHAATPRVHGLAGEKPGTERWLVTFKTRSFDLKTFRDANFGGASPDVVARIVRGLEAEVRADQKGFVDFVEEVGGRVTAQWWLINGCAVEVPAAAVDKVRAHPRVLKMDPEEVVYPVGFIKVSTNSKNHNADSNQNRNIKGKGVAVAIMDTGLDNPMGTSGRPHRTFFVNGDINNKTGGGIGGSRLVAHRNFGRMSNADDPHNHGTGVAGIAAGEVWGNSLADRGHSPLSGIGNYKIADSRSGGAQFQNIVNAYQGIAQDAARLKIVASNNSYTGSPDPTHVSQQALDSVALNANVLPVVAAGNSGASTRASQSAANGIAVAAITPATGTTLDKTVATFSSRGPLTGDTQRFYPDMAANGVKTVMPLRDQESRNYVASGTSMASPQVCGAAAVFRSVKPTADTLQTKAALLATTEDISKQNTRPPYNSRNAYGMGYLRDDRLVALAQSRTALVQNGTISSTTTPVVVTFRVLSRKGYAVALTWNRHTLTAKNWSDLNLEVKFGTQTLATSASPRNLYEKVVFLAPSSGIVRILVSAKSLEKTSIKFGLAATDIPPPFIDGKMIPYGLGCLGTGKAIGVETIIPADLRSTFGKTYNELGLGYDNHRVQQVYDAKGVPASFQARVLAFRFEDLSFPGPVRGYWAELEIDMGYSPNAPAVVSDTFANNIAGTPTRVLAKKRVNLPDWTAKNGSADKFAIKIGLDRPFIYRQQANRHLMVDMRKTNSSAGNTITSYFVDATNNASKMYGSRIYGSTPAATKGLVATGVASVLGFNSAATGAVPRIENDGVPEIGGSYKVNISQAKATTAAALILGTQQANLDLTGAGAPGCRLLASLDLLLLAVPIDAFGKGTQSIPIPNDKGLIQANLFHQAAVLDAGANRLGFAFSGGLKGIVGGQP